MRDAAVTNPNEGVGVSTTAINLAAALADLGWSPTTADQGGCPYGRTTGGPAEPREPDRPGAAGDDRGRVRAAGRPPASGPSPPESPGRARAGLVPRPGPDPRSGRAAKPAKPRRVQRMFAIEEELDKKLWLYAIHVGKDRSEVVNDLLRPLVASMVLYDSRDRRPGCGDPSSPRGDDPPPLDDPR